MSRDSPISLLNIRRPYVKGLPITATVLSSKSNGDFSEELIRPTYEDAYTLEYRDFYSAIVDGAEVKTTAVDGECVLLRESR